MTEGHRLRGLQMGEARHHGVGMLDGTIHQRALKRGERPVDVVDDVADVEPEIGRNLIVARTCGMQAACGRSDQFAETAFDIHVNVFERALERE